MIYSTLHKLKVSHWVGKHFITTRSIFFKIVYGLIRRINLHIRVKKNGINTLIPIREGVGFLNLLSDYERWMDKLLPKLFHEDDVFIDIGANTGQTLLKVLTRYSSVEYFAVEPNEQCAVYLSELCRLNGFSNVKIWNYAFSDVEGETELLLRYDDDILGTTTPSFRKFTKYAFTKKVNMLRGDSIILSSDIERISLIKIDVEGGESKVVGGLLDTLQRFEPYVLCEILPLVSRDSAVAAFRKNSAKELLQMIKSLRYQIFNLSNMKLIESTDDLSSSLESSNYLFVPENKMEMITGIFSNDRS